MTSTHTQNPATIPLPFLNVEAKCYTIDPFFGSPPNFSFPSPSPPPPLLFLSPDEPDTLGSLGWLGVQVRCVAPTQTVLGGRGQGHDPPCVRQKDSGFGYSRTFRAGSSV